MKKGLGILATVALTAAVAVAGAHPVAAQKFRATPFEGWYMGTMLSAGAGILEESFTGAPITDAIGATSSRSEHGLEARVGSLVLIGYGRWQDLGKGRHVFLGGETSFTLADREYHRDSDRPEIRNIDIDGLRDIDISARVGYMPNPVTLFAIQAGPSHSFLDISYDFHDARGVLSNAVSREAALGYHYGVSGTVAVSQKVAVRLDWLVRDSLDFQLAYEDNVGGTITRNRHDFAGKAFLGRLGLTYHFGGVVVEPPEGAKAVAARGGLYAGLRGFYSGASYRKEIEDARYGVVPYEGEDGLTTLGGETSGIGFTFGYGVRLNRVFSHPIFENLYFSVEGEMDFNLPSQELHESTTTTPVDPPAGQPNVRAIRYTERFERDFDIGLTGRVGYLVRPDTLFYFRAGPTWGWHSREVSSATLDSTTFETGSDGTVRPVARVTDLSSREAENTLSGFRFGVGLEAALSPKVHARLDWSYTDYEDWQPFLEKVGNHYDTRVSFGFVYSIR